MMRNKFLWFLGGAVFLFPPPVYAHEAYVLTHDQFMKGLDTPSPHPLNALINQSHVHAFLIISICVAVTYTLSVLWSTTSWAGFLDRQLKRLNVAGPLIIRLAISASFFFAAQANVFLGPELPLAGLPGAILMRYTLFVLSLMILIGLYTEIAAFIGLLIMGFFFGYYGVYLFTYTNYLGELLVLWVFGSRFFSVDRYLFGTKKFLEVAKRFEWLEVPVVRILYGVALIYAGYTIKFAHQSLTVDVYNQYHLVNFFHASAGFIAAGAGLSEIMIGAFILLGLVQRLTVAISLVFITLSLLYFHEMLWPHLMLYGISFSLFINSSDPLTIDHYMVPWARGIRDRIFSAIFHR